MLHLTNGIGETVLHFLAVEDAQAALVWLRARGADINTKNEFGTPVLFEVASLGYKKLFGWLIEAGVDVHARDADDQDLIEHLLEYDKNEMAVWVRAQIAGAQASWRPRAVRSGCLQTESVTPPLGIPRKSMGRQ